VIRDRRQPTTASAPAERAPLTIQGAEPTAPPVQAAAAQGVATVPATVYQPRPVPAEFGPADVAERAWRYAAALRADALVAVSSADGGVGRSTLVAALGGVLALAVPGPVMAVDLVPAPWGGLGVRVGQQNSGTVWDVVRDLDTVSSRADVECWAQRGLTGLLALVGEPEGQIRRPPRQDEAAAVAARIRGLFPLTVGDLPSALTGGVWLTLAAATAPVLVARAATDSVRHTLRLMTHLSASGHARVVRDCVLVVMTTTPSVPRQVRAVVRQAGDIAGAVYVVPYDPGLARPEPIDPRRLRRRTRTALVQVAEAVLQRCAAERPAAATGTERV
jgi:MinD-like ATPase involved in chromosome partitioning or flagellar assembly